MKTEWQGLELLEEVNTAILNRFGEPGDKPQCWPALYLAPSHKGCCPQCKMGIGNTRGNAYGCINRVLLEHFRCNGCHLLYLELGMDFPERCSCCHAIAEIVTHEGHRLCRDCRDLALEAAEQGLDYAHKSICTAAGRSMGWCDCEAAS